MNPHLNGQLIYNKGGKGIQWRKTASLVNVVGNTGQLHEKESNFVTFSYHVKK